MGIWPYCPQIFTTYPNNSAYTVSSNSGESGCDTLPPELRDGCRIWMIR